MLENVFLAGYFKYDLVFMYYEALLDNYSADVDLINEIALIDYYNSLCLLVKDNRIISQGYNGFLPGAEHKSIVRNNHEQSTVHAEQNAVSHAAKSGISLEKSTAYITHYPCIICCRLLHFFLVTPSMQ